MTSETLKKTGRDNMRKFWIIFILFNYLLSLELADASDTAVLPIDINLTWENSIRFLQSEPFFPNATATESTIRKIPLEITCLNAGGFSVLASLVGTSNEDVEIFVTLHGSNGLNSSRIKLDHSNPVPIAQSIVPLCKEKLFLRLEIHPKVECKAGPGQCKIQLKLEPQ